MNFFVDVERFLNLRASPWSEMGKCIIFAENIFNRYLKDDSEWRLSVLDKPLHIPVQVNVDTIPPAVKPSTAGEVYTKFPWARTVNELRDSLAAPAASSTTCSTIVGIEKHLRQMQEVVCEILAIKVLPLFLEWETGPDGVASKKGMQYRIDACTLEDLLKVLLDSRGTEVEVCKGW